jgi:hypothetical protein
MLLLPIVEALGSNTSIAHLAEATMTSTTRLPSAPARDGLEMDLDFDIDADTTIDVFILGSPATLPFVLDEAAGAIPPPAPSRPC